MKSEHQDQCRREELDRWLAQLKQRLEGSPVDLAQAGRTMGTLFAFALDDQDRNGED